MKKLFRYDSPFIKWVNRMGWLVILNILWLICCLPVVTIGASTAAMYRIAMGLAQKRDDVNVVGDFFRAFRANFKQGTLAWLILLIPTLLIVLNLSLLLSGDLGYGMASYILCLIPVPPLLFISAYVFAYVATFEDKPLRTILNSAIISISNLPRTLLMVMLNILPLVVYLMATEVFLRLLFVWLLFAFALIAYLNSKLILIAFRPYLPQAEEEIHAKEESGEDAQEKQE